MMTLSTLALTVTVRGPVKHIAGMCEFGGKGQIDTLRKWRLFLAKKRRLVKAQPMFKM